MATDSRTTDRTRKLSLHFTGIVFFAAAFLLYAVAWLADTKALLVIGLVFAGLICELTAWTLGWPRRDDGRGEKPSDPVDPLRRR